MQFSVLIPVYIKENPKNLDLALSSIFSQTVLPDECVIVEDGPITNELKAILDKYLTEYPEIIKLYSLNTNMGMGFAMNYGLHKCSHEWIARADSDDINKNNRFEIQLNYLKKFPSIDVLGSFIEEFNETPGDLKQYRKVELAHLDIIKQMKFRNPINHMTVIFRKSSAIAAGGYWDQRVMEDYNLWYNLYKNAAVFANIDYPLVYARIGNNMVGRRHGFKYFSMEMSFFSKMYKDGFISPPMYFLTSILRFSLRVMPISYLKQFYKFFLRN
jgi:glycosyltransferase involved in cell wall biosynthesis